MDAEDAAPSPHLFFFFFFEETHNSKYKKSFLNEEMRK